MLTQWTKILPDIPSDQVAFDMLIFSNNVCTVDSTNVAKNIKNKLGTQVIIIIL